MSLTNEQRAHDLAIAVLTSPEQEKIFSDKKLNSKTSRAEAYTEAYLYLLNKFEELLSKD